MERQTLERTDNFIPTVKMSVDDYEKLRHAEQEYLRIKDRIDEELKEKENEIRDELENKFDMELKEHRAYFQYQKESEESYYKKRLNEEKAKYEQEIEQLNKNIDILQSLLKEDFKKIEGYKSDLRAERSKRAVKWVALFISWLLTAVSWILFLMLK